MRIFIYNDIVHKVHRTSYRIVTVYPFMTTVSLIIVDPSDVIWKIQL